MAGDDWKLVHHTDVLMLGIRRPGTQTAVC